MEGWQVGILIAEAGTCVLLLVFAVLIWRRQGQMGTATGDAVVLPKVLLLGEGQNRIERTVRDDLRSAREEGQASGRLLRQEVGQNLVNFGEVIRSQTTQLFDIQRTQHDDFASRLATVGEINAQAGRALRDGVEQQLHAMRVDNAERLDQFASQLRHGLADFAQNLKEYQDTIASAIGEVREQTVQHLETMKRDSIESAKGLHEQVGRSLADFGNVTRSQTDQLFVIQRAQHDDFASRLVAIGEAGQREGKALRDGVEAQLFSLRHDNAEKLEQMRSTVDEKLQGTLEQRLGDSFRLVSDRLEAVHKGLGEMQALASGVGDLKRVLTNVKTRGSWGEVQLGVLLDQILTRNQYVSNAAMSETGGERVEFAIRLPDGMGGQDLLLPIDAKFPVEDYERLQLAADRGDALAVEEASRNLDLRIRGCAKDICSKYINPPRTTDFAILFLPTEGLYAEVIRRPGLSDDLQRCWRVSVAGPTTLAAILNSLQMGFRTLAIQKRSSEVWQVLGAVKTEFGKFGPVLDGVKKKLQQASDQIDKAGVRERAIQRKLRQIEALPETDAVAVMEMDETSSPVDDDTEDVGL